MDNKKIFPKDFWWGSATSGPQSEGDFNKPHKSVFDYWFEVEPEIFFDGVGPKIASNFYNSYKEDIAMLKEIGLNSFRISIQWTRLIKDLETGEPDEDAIRFYNSVIDECIKNKIIIVINLHHFDLPVELYDKYGGWESKHVVELFVKFAETAFKLFGDRVHNWTTFNEPIVVVEGQYLYEFHYPKVIDGKKAVQAMFNINLASAKTVKKYKDLKQDGAIGIVLNLTPSYPRSESAQDIKVSKFADDFFNNSFLDPAIKGVFPKSLTSILEKDGVMWDATDEEMEIIKENTIDFLGVNYYQPVYVRESTNGEAYEQFVPLDAEINEHRGWIIYPKGIYDLSMELKNEYGNIKYFIAENGMGFEGEDMYKDDNGVINDTYRVDFYTRHLTFLHKAIEEGANCFGFHTWTFVDNWSWLNEYKNRYGFVSLNIDTQERTRKTSSYWYNDLITNRVLKEK